MRKTTKRFRGNRPTEGPTVAVVATRGGLTIKVLEGRERPQAPRLSVKASDDSRKAVAAAVALLQERITVNAKRPVAVLVEA